MNFGSFNEDEPVAPDTIVTADGQTIYLNDEAFFASLEPGEGASPGLHDCTPEKRGARGNDTQAGRALAPPSPLCRLTNSAAPITDLCKCYPGTCADFDRRNP